jgi:4-hydroxy-2-oxoglutarate aldolase
MTRQFAGVFPPLTTPFSGDEVDTGKFKENIKKYNRFDLAGYAILGSTGENVFLSDEESLKLVEAAKEAALPGHKIIVGTARESTKATLEFSNKMATLGANAALVRTPSYYKPRMSRDVLKRHYVTLADSARLPIIIYHFPQLTGISVESELVLELAGHPNIIGIKDSSGNLALLGEVVPQVKPSFCFLIGSGSVFLAGLELGACGGILALADAAPGPCSRLYKLFLDGKKEEALRLQYDLIPLSKSLTQIHGIPGIKYALDLLGFYGGSPRPPLMPLEEKEKAGIALLLQKNGLLS